MPAILKKHRIFIIIISIVTGLFIAACAKQQHFMLSQFIAPDICGGCHSDIYDQWKNSLHNLSHDDAVYNSVAKHYLKGLTDKGEILEAESCVKCHTPVGAVTGFPVKVSDDLAKTPDIARAGIQCDFCHSATGAYRMYNNGMRLSPGSGNDNPGVKRGPFKDAEPSFHKAEYSEFHTGSEICGTCHNVTHVAFDTRLETTYDEWARGPYNSKEPGKRVTCQGCHMYQRPGIVATGATERPENPGTAASGSKQRPHIFTHYFIGGNTYTNLKSDPDKSFMAAERLKHAAELFIDTSSASKGDIFIDVKNTGAGHYLPTGLTDTRQMWLEITVKDSSGKIVYSSGKLDSDGYIAPGSFVYNTVFGDADGKAVRNIAKARKVLRDRRVPPGESLRETVKIPDVKKGKYSVSVRLLYRGVAQEILDEVSGKGKIKFPVVVMTEANKNINL